MERLFDFLSQGRPERVAQGALHFALLRDPQFQKYISKELGRTGPPQGVFQEQKTIGGWRADVKIEWPHLQGPSYLELKLAAGLTPRQRQAADQGKIDALVVPSGTLCTPPEVRRLTWKELADQVSDLFLQRLFREADAAASWGLSRIEQSDAEADFLRPRRMVEADSTTCPLLYRFLITVHQHLSVNGSLVDYEDGRVSGGGSKKRHWGYYGFQFSVADESFWLGFTEHDVGPLTAGFVVTQTLEKSEPRILGPQPYPLDAESLAMKVASAVANRMGGLGPGAK